MFWWYPDVPVNEAVCGTEEVNLCLSDKEMDVTKTEFDFETWFSNLAMMVLDKTGVDFRDRESVRQDYDDGRNLADVADEIADDYA